VFYLWAVVQSLQEPVCHHVSGCLVIRCSLAARRTEGGGKWRHGEEEGGYEAR
jgi:hypothetical protein